MRNESRTFLDWLGLRNAPNWRVARPLGPLLSVILALLFIGAVTAAFVALARAISGGEGATGLGTGALIVGLLGAPFLVWSTVIKHQTLRYQKEGHITDRISKAVEQLGAEKTVKKDGKEETVPNIEVRIGAILSLERIAQDSTAHDNGRDHVRVMEILCAYVRENAKAETAEDHPFGEWEPHKEHARHIQGWARGLKGPRGDVQLVLNVIGRRTAAQRRVEAAWPDAPGKDTIWPFDTPCPELPTVEGDKSLSAAQIDAFTEKLKAWRHTLRRYSGYRLDLRGANLQRADLSAKRPDASDAVFSGALLAGARMEGADLSGAKMQGAYLNGVRMEGADLRRVRMEGVDLGGARMEGVDLSGARMEGADLSGAKMQGAYLNGVRMEGADLRVGARMEGADLRGARMERAYLYGVRMDSHTSLDKVTFTSAALRDLDYSEVPISAEQVNSAFGDASVTLPEDITRPAHWPDWELDWGTFHTEYPRWRANPAAYTPPPPPKPED